MNNKDLTKNPLDDYTPEPSGPSVLDRASVAIADQVSKYKEFAKKIDEPIVTGEKSPDIALTPSAFAPTRNSPFNQSVPDFKLGSTKQAILANQWDFCKHHWNIVDHSTMNSNNHELQEILFATTLRVVRDLAVDEFVGIQPMNDECCKVYILEADVYDQTRSSNTKINAELNLRAHVVEANRRQFQTSWTTELAQDFRAMHRDNFMHEVSKVYAMEIGQEIYNEIKHIHFNAAEKIIVDGSNDKHTALELYRVSNEVGQRSWRGSANKLIASNAVVASLLRAEDLTVEDDSDRRYGHVNYVGKIGHKLEVFVDATMLPGESLLIYKGGNGSCDAGLLYCPHVMLVSSGIMHVNPSTFQPTIPMLTQYGMHENTLKNYTSHVTMTGMSYSVEDDKILTELFEQNPLRSALTGTASFYSPHMPLGREEK